MESIPEPVAELSIRCRQVAVDWKTFRQFISQLARELTRTPFTVAIVSDVAIRRLNLNFRKKDAPTDVLSFPVKQSRNFKKQPNSVGREDDLGDVVISIPTAARAAQEHGWSVDQELQALALHGVLHLMGYDHETDQGQMARAERRWGRRLHLSQTLISRRYRKARDSA